MKTVIIFDLEATCWDRNISNSNRNSEIIEIGSVKINPNTSEIIDKFDVFVKPIEYPILSDFCKNLTSIQQSDVDYAESLEIELQKFNVWMGNDVGHIMSWGNYDVNQIKRELNRKNIVIEELQNKLLKHVNLKDKFAIINKIKPCGVGQALRYIKKPFIGIQHRGIDDAINISVLYKSIKDELIY